MMLCIGQSRQLKFTSGARALLLRKASDVLLWGCSRLRLALAQHLIHPSGHDVAGAALTDFIEGRVGGFEVQLQRSDA